MHITDIAFGITDWSDVVPIEQKGEVGTAFWRTRNFGSMRVRMVDYTPGYVAAHWCAFT